MQSAPDCECETAARPVAGKKKAACKALLLMSFVYNEVTLRLDFARLNRHGSKRDRHASVWRALTRAAQRTDQRAVGFVEDGPNAL
jgi:hypothetical protein